jgi:hypothetical protein
VINRIKNRLLNVIVAPYVECPNCQALCEYRKGTKKCATCSAKVVIADDTLVHLCIVQPNAKENPYMTYTRCPNCRRLLVMGTRLCPHCREELSDEYVLFSSFIEVLKTMACDEARTIESFNPFAVILVGISAYMLITGLVMGGFGFSFTLPLLTLTPLLAIMLWYYRFGMIDDDDQDYLQARQRVRKALKLWTFMLAAELFLLYLLIFPH